MVTFEEESTVDGYTLVINVCALFIGCLGNIIVCIVIACNRSLHTLADFYLFNLSISDLLTLITKFISDFYYYRNLSALAVTEPQREANTILDGHAFDNRTAHYVNSWTGTTALYASVFTVTTFTIERYLAICRPFVAQSMSKTSRVRAIIGAIWSVGALFASMLLAIHYAAEEISDESIILALNCAQIVVYFLCLIVPNSAIIAMYILIGRELKRSSIERPTTLRANRRHAKALKMIAIIIFISFLSWAPLFTQILLAHCFPDEDYWQDLTFKAYYLTRVTYILPSVLNPIIYTIMSRKFREALKDFISKTWKKLGGRTSVFASTQTDEMEMS